MHNLNLNLFYVFNLGNNRSIESKHTRNKRRKLLQKEKQKIQACDERMKNEFKINSLKEKALLYIDERDRADRLQMEVTALSSQLISRNKTSHHKTFSSQSILNNDILAKLPACATLLPVMVEINEFELGTGTFGTVITGKLVGLELEVAVKRSKGFALISEGRICQFFSGHPNFLYFFGMMGIIILFRI